MTDHTGKNSNASDGVGIDRLVVSYTDRIYEPTILGGSFTEGVATEWVGKRDATRYGEIEACAALKGDGNWHLFETDPVSNGCTTEPLGLAVQQNGVRSLRQSIQAWSRGTNEVQRTAETVVKTCPGGIIHIKSLPQAMVPNQVHGDPNFIPAPSANLPTY